MNIKKAVALISVAAFLYTLGQACYLIAIRYIVVDS